MALILKKLICKISKELKSSNMKVKPKSIFKTWLSYIANALLNSNNQTDIDVFIFCNVLIEFVIFV